MQLDRETTAAWLTAMRRLDNVYLDGKILMMNSAGIGAFRNRFRESRREEYILGLRVGKKASTAR